MPENPYAIDMRPFPEPVNPFAFAAAELRKRYPNLAGENLQGVQWLEHLAARSPDLKTTDRLAVVVLARAATQGDDRQWYRGVLDFIDAEFTAASA